MYLLLNCIYMKPYFKTFARLKNYSYMDVYIVFYFQETAWHTTMVCFSAPTIPTMISGLTTVPLREKVDGGTKAVMRQILMGSMQT